jgi:hypothetical protein
MTTDDQASQGRKLSGAGVLMLGHGFIWFHASWPGGIFTLHPLNHLDAFFRAEIVIGAIVTTYGMLVWRSAFRDLSLANYIIVLSCVPILLVCVSKISEWVYVLNRQSRYAPGIVIAIAMPVCIISSLRGGPTARTCASDFTIFRDPADRYPGPQRECSFALPSCSCPCLVHPRTWPSLGCTLWVSY